LYKTTAKLVKVVLNLLFTVPATDVPEKEFWPNPISAKPYSLPVQRHTDLTP